jgi:hypothetical protein
VVPGRAHEREPAPQRRFDRGPGGERPRLERGRGADGVAVEPERVLDAANELDVLRRVAQEEFVGRRAGGLSNVVGEGQDSG